MNINGISESGKLNSFSKSAHRQKSANSEKAVKPMSSTTDKIRATMVAHGYLPPPPPVPIDEFIDQAVLNLKEAMDKVRREE